ncbi:L-histidine N(alpha)-methyltransferase [Oscillatoria sp. CS-180]|uniref:L-histidine N(alpha)-methyltransferase n=1 Tax=Oscillatoria sp. CS-180 TaxID=3021720 RepID=UPI00232FA9FD|nr:L-histidine N(alpha)-methyltransferase [Oscillatoria sp. CS-180]MDB9528901.1 L-histidine N(alpha)-methyltransferase [Oscillatoria sp. CS-180]
MPASSHPTSFSSEKPSRLHKPPVLSRDRLIIEHRLTAESHDAAVVGRDVIAGLSQTPKSLPPKYFYDDQGSQLFEAITELPEYYLTRTERRILETFAGAIADQVGACDLVELGSGSSSKTRILFDAYQRSTTPLRYIPVDVSSGILKESTHALLNEYPKLTIHGLISTYEAALAELPPAKLPRRMIAFIGSTLGNLSPFQAQQFFQSVSQASESNDYFLLGVDLHKDSDVLNAAYNDSAGVTAAFNLNMLSHLNWRFQGNFDLSQFRHVARYNERDRQIEMYIESLRSQTVTLKSLDLDASFRAGERLLSEISRKFNLDELSQELFNHGLTVVDTFTDEQQWFALILCKKL